MSNVLNIVKKVVIMVKGSKSKNSKSLINNIFKSFHKDIRFLNS